MMARAPTAFVGALTAPRAVDRLEGFDWRETTRHLTLYPTST
jgi:hypothetical protein